MSVSRRQFIAASAAGVALTGCDLPWHRKPPIVVHRPGMYAGHLLRDRASLPPPSTTLKCDVAIVGSGAAALTVAWKLAKEGHRNFILIDGPEADGNAAGGRLDELTYPTGGHYLPLPSIESKHIREMLSDVGVIQANPFSEHPSFDETVLVHAPEERLLIVDHWQENVILRDPDTERFLKLVESLRVAKGVDGRKLFAMPVVLSSQDPQWRKLDQLTFKAWLIQENYVSTALHWYLNYVCRDDYGAGFDRVSAWAGLHYFACRSGQAKNADAGTVLTWPDGLQSLTRMLRQRIGFTKEQNIQGFATHILDRIKHAEITIATPQRDGIRTVLLLANKVICATPLHVASHIVEGLGELGFDRSAHLPSYAPWMVANFILNRFPDELEGAPLAWDNVIYEGKGLGYVVSTHQLIRAAKPARTVFTSYYALNDHSPTETRRWLTTATDIELLELASGDLKLAYGERFWRHVERVEITLRGHAMASPLPGYLSNKGIAALREASGRIQFAHSDLSGYSVFEEAAWWGYQAAGRLI